MPIYKDFAGINICIYDPIEGDSGAHGTSTNIIGYDPNKSSFTDNVVAGSNISNLTITSEITSWLSQSTVMVCELFFLVSN